MSAAFRLWGWGGHWQPGQWKHGGMALRGGTYANLTARTGDRAGEPGLAPRARMAVLPCTTSGNGAAMGAVAGWEQGTEWSQDFYLFLAQVLIFRGAVAGIIVWSIVGCVRPPPAAKAVNGDWWEPLLALHRADGPLRLWCGIFVPLGFQL